ncbi:MAG TPA: 2OG-Fe(II) oxygenase [Terriglobia bacterium]|nr:2OG-Fe(II) oxygenase [Terriglobia bacterium]
MEYLNADCLNGISSGPFHTQRPYPWISIENTLTRDGFQLLRESLPDVSLFERKVGIKRSHGQCSHNRYILHYRPDLKLAEPWREFIAEIHSEIYESFLRRMCGLQRDEQFVLTLEWYYAWQGCSVSPHCDAQRKLGTHIFYFNTAEDWDARWGGEILILDDGGRFRAHSAPDFDQLRVAAALDAVGNESLLFQRTPHSWHGVRPLECPPDALRKLFIVTINIPTFQVWWRRLRGKDADGYPMKAC